MRFLDLCEKEVVSVEEGRFIGHVRDLEFDPVCGKICAIIVPGPDVYKRQVLYRPIQYRCQG